MGRFTQSSIAHHRESRLSRLPYSSYLSLTRKIYLLRSTSKKSSPAPSASVRHDTFRFSDSERV